MIYCHKCLWIDSSLLSHVLYVALLLPDGSCIHLTLSSFPFSLPLSLGQTLTWTVSADWSHNITVLTAIQNSVSVGSHWGVDFQSVVVWQGRARATHVPSGRRQYTCGGTQNLYMLQYFACHFCSQHIWGSKNHLIPSMSSRKSRKLLPYLLECKTSIFCEFGA
jgi:hypothetical protein